MIDIAKLHEKIVSAGIPLKSVRVAAGAVELVFMPEATTRQRDDAKAIAAAFDLTATEKKVAAAKKLLTDNWGTLSAAEKALAILLRADE